MTTTLTPEQQAWYDGLVFTAGAGRGVGDDGTCHVCVEQAATILTAWQRTGHFPAPGPVSDDPPGVCPVIRRGKMAVNDSWAWQGDNAARTAALKPVLLAQLGTASAPEVEAARAMLARRFAVRIAAPFWLARAGRHEDAAALRALVLTPETLVAVRHRCRQARSRAAYGAFAAYAYAAAYAADAADGAAYADDAAAAAADAAYADDAADAADGAAAALLTRYCYVLLAMCAVDATNAAAVLANDRTVVDAPGAPAPEA